MNVFALLHMCCPWTSERIANVESLLTYISDSPNSHPCQYRSDILNGMCLYDFVRLLYKKKMIGADRKYLTRIAVPSDETAHQKGRPSNKRYQFRKQHPQASTHLLVEHSQSRGPVLYGP